MIKQETSLPNKNDSAKFTERSEKTFFKEILRDIFTPEKMLKNVDSSFFL